MIPYAVSETCGAIEVFSASFLRDDSKIALIFFFLSCSCRFFFCARVSQHPHAPILFCLSPTTAQRSHCCGCERHGSEGGERRSLPLEPVLFVCSGWAPCPQASIRGGAKISNLSQQARER